MWPIKYLGTSLFIFELIFLVSANNVAVDVDGSVNQDDLLVTDPIEQPIPYLVEHSLSMDGKFSSRGVIQVTQGRRKSISFSNNLVLSQSEKNDFEELLLNEGLYRIRVKSQLDNDSANWIMASIPICDLVKSNFKEEMKFLFETIGSSIDSSTVASINGGGGGVSTTQDTSSSSSTLKLLSIDYRVQTSRFTKAKNCHQIALPSEIRFSSAASFTSSTPAQTLAVQPMDGAASNGAPPPGVPPQLVRANEMKNKNGGGPGGGAGGSGHQQQDQQSFIRKYWYIIVPMMVLMMTGSPPPEGEGKGGKGAAPPPS